MYNQFVLKYLIEGGAKIEKMNMLDIPDSSVKTFITPENILNPMGVNDRVPPLNNDILNSNPTLETGAQSIKECKLILSNEMGNALITFANNSVKDLKDRLRQSIKDLEANQNAIYKMYRDSLILGSAGNKMDITSYFNTIESKLKVARSDVKKADEEFKKNIIALVNAYNQDKRGRHPPLMEKSAFIKIKQAIMKTESEQTGFSSETGVVGTLMTGSEEIGCTINSINLEKGIISVTYTKIINDKTKHYDSDVSFRNLCIGTEPQAQ